MATSAVTITAVYGPNGQPLPLTGSTLGSGSSVTVKQERHDEAEIQELAAKMLETQKANLAKQQQQAAQMQNRATVSSNGQPPLANGQVNILNYLTRGKGATPTPGSNTNGQSNGKSLGSTNGSSAPDSEKKPCDEESQKGHFGWAVFGKTHIPYIYRQTEKYCAVRMVECKLLGKYLNCLHPDIYSSCTCVRSYYITEAESRLFNEINHKHCDSEFGRDLFTLKDLVVRLSDASKFFQFLDICYRKLISGSKTPSEKCGFIRINKESVVPYTVRNSEQVVPLFYFEGETENLKQKADYLSGWDLAYLKFCCKVQGIRNELFSSESVAVISLTDIKSYFPNGTEFEDYWPSKVVDSNLLLGPQRSSGPTNSVNWTRQPSAPPPKIITPAVGSKQSQQQQQQQQQQSQQMVAKRGAAYSQIPGSNLNNAANTQRLHAASLAAATQQALNGAWLAQSPGAIPMMHAQMLATQAQQQNHPAVRPNYRGPTDNLMLSNRQPYTYNNGAISMQPVNNHNQSNVPPPLVRAGGQNAAHQMKGLDNRTTGVSLSLNNAEKPDSRLTNEDFQNFWSNCTSVEQILQQQHANIINHPSPPSTRLHHPPPYPPQAPSAVAQVPPQLVTNLNSSYQQHPSSSVVSSKICGQHQSPNYGGASIAPDFQKMSLYNQLDEARRQLIANTLKNATQNNNNNNSPMCANKNPKVGVNSTSQNGFSKPSIPPLIPMAALESSRQGGVSATKRPADSFAEFDRRFKMTDEMKAVVQKVLSNPDLSTFIQTNTSNTFVPFISPPISPATNQSANSAGINLNGIQHHNLPIFQNSSLTIVPNPNPNQSQNPNPNPNSNSNSLHHQQRQTNASVAAAAPRQKSVICSTSTIPSCTTTPSPSPTRTPTNNTSGTTEVIDLSSPRRSSFQAATAYLQQQQQVAAAQQHHQRAQQQQQQQQQQNGRGSQSNGGGNSATMHLQRHAAAVQQGSVVGMDPSNRLHVIPEIASGNVHIPPYKVQKVCVENVVVHCINMQAYTDSDQLMTLTDFRESFFPTTQLEQCKRLIEALGVELYKGNRRQIQVLLETGRTQSENIPLVKVRDVKKYMPQLTFMIRNQEQPPLKRTRVS